MNTNPYEPPLKSHAKDASRQRRSLAFALLGALGVIAAISLGLCATYAWLWMCEVKPRLTVNMNDRLIG